MTLSFERQLQEFVGDPDNGRAFDALEEQLFLGGHWDELVEVYRTRLSAESVASELSAQANLLFRLGQVLEERCLDTEQAQRTYWEVARLDPTFAPALRQLRRLHSRNDQWDMVLQIAEVEGQLVLKPFERAEYLTDMGRVWLEHMGDPEQALQTFDEALAASDVYLDGLAGRARALEALERFAEAAVAWEKLAGLQRGPDRAPPLVAWAKLLTGPLADPDRAIELYRGALTEDPRNEAAVEALAVLAGTRGQWELVRDLFERRFDLASGARRRTGIALEAGHMSLERFGDPLLARMWFSRAQELSPDDVGVHQSIAELERMAGNESALSESLEQVVGLAGGTAPVSVLLETANLRTERGEEEAALELLRIAHRRAFENPLVLEALSDSLMRLDQYEELAEVLDQRAALASDDPDAQVDALCELGRLHEEQLSDPGAALDAYARAFALRPDTPGAARHLEALYQKAEDWEEMRHFLERAADQAPEPERVSYRCALGELLFDRFDDIDGASCAFEMALDANPEDARALRGLERVATQTGDGEALLRVHSREAAVTTDRERKAQLARELVRGLEERGRPDEALPWAEQWAIACPEDRVPLEVLVRLHEQADRTPELRGVLERLDALLGGPEQAENRRRLSQLESDEEGAITWLERSLESQPNDVESLRALCDRYHDAGRLEDQARIQRRLADQLPPDEQIRSLDELALLLEEQLGDVDGAVVVLWRMQELPGCPQEVGRRLAQILDRVGRFEELAQLLLEQRRNVSNDSTEATRIDLERAQLLLDRLGQAEEATSVLRAIREREPGHPEATRILERALRQHNDPLALAALLAERAREETDPSRRASRELECAILVEEGGGELEHALGAYAALADATANPEVSDEAGRRLEGLLERQGDWQSLRARLESRLERSDAGSVFALRERLAVVCRDRLGDRDACIAHFEAAGALDPSRDSVWRSLGLLYREAGRDPDWSRVIEAEIATGPETDRERSLRASAARLAIEGDRRDAARNHYERLLELDPGHLEASEFLIEQYDRENRPADVVPLLEARLASLDPADLGETTSLRLRIASLCADDLDDLSAAIEVLEAAGPNETYEALVAEPLADFYQRAGRGDDLAGLCRRRAENVADNGERAGWLMRLGDVLTDRGDGDGAVNAYRSVLDARPGDRDASTALRQLYRDRGEAQPLAELLEVQLDPASGDDRLPVLVELAELMSGPLERPADALEHYKHALSIAPDHSQVFGRAFDLAVALGRHDDLLALLNERLSGNLAPADRATLLTRRGDLLSSALGRADEAPPVYREALALDPGQRDAHRGLRVVLESLERWPAVLDCLFVEARGADPSEREAIYESAAGIAAEHLSRDAALPWLERLRGVRRQDPTVLSRIAEIHRQAGRSESLLRAIEDELALVEDEPRRIQLSLERARILETDLRSPERALRVLEDARARLGDRPDCLEVLEVLDRLYASTGRVRERAEIVEVRLAIDGVRPEAIADVHRELAELWEGSLGDPVRALPHRLHAVDLTAHDDSARAQRLRELSDTLWSTDWREQWTRAAEAELEVIANAGSTDAALVERSAQLYERLGRVYGEELGRRRDALRYWRALVDSDAEIDPELRTRATSELIDGLRACADVVELERRLTDRLESEDSHSTESAVDWLELARLRDERLHRPSAAARAYERATKIDGRNVDAWRGLRRTTERLGDWVEVVRCLEQEAELTEDSDAAERAARWRRIGELAWHRIGALERSRLAYARALAADSGDQTALRALASLAQLRDDWRAEIDHCEQEISILADTEAERRADLWLRIGGLTRDRGDDVTRALAAYTSAAAAHPLQAAQRREWAELYRLDDDPVRYAEVFADWCDSSDGGASWVDHLDLANALDALGRREAALERVRKSTSLGPASADPWLLQARLLEEADLPRDAADALDSAAVVLEPVEGADVLRRAAELVESEDPERAFERLCSAVDLDPAHLEARAAKARVAATLCKWPEAESAAAMVMDMASSQPALPPARQIECALVGGGAARERGRNDSAVQFYAAAVELDPTHRAARAGLGECLYEIGDLAGARNALEPICGDEGEVQATHLAAIGAALEEDGDPEAALQIFERAIAIDPSVADAHAGRVRIHDCAGDIDDALAALEDWANHTPNLPRRAELHLRAARLARDTDRRDDALSAWTAAVEADPNNGSAWCERAEWLHGNGALEEAHDVADAGLSVAPGSEWAARLHAVRGAIFEDTGRSNDAVEAYASVVSNDPRATTAALSQARLLRSLGEWARASSCLESHALGHPDPGHGDLAEVHAERGRLLSGPLENVDEAIRCYESSLAIDPFRIEALESMARLLGHVPEREAEAVETHRRLLALDPTRTASIRALCAVSDRRGNETTHQVGLAFLRALGAASPDEAARAHHGIPVRLGDTPAMSNPVEESLRRLVQETGHEIALAFEAPADVALPTGRSDEESAWLTALHEEEDQLGAPGLTAMSDDDLAAALMGVATVVLSPRSIGEDDPRAAALEGALGRWSRRRLRRLLEGISLPQISAIDVTRWRSEIRQMAAAAALDRCGGDLRTALLALALDADEPLPSETADLSDLVRRSPEATALLHRATATWCDLIRER